MKVSIFSVLLATFLLTSMIELTPPAEAQSPIIIYTVYWDCSCPVSPPLCGEVVGKWTIECDGSWSGWGWQPDEYDCSYYTTAFRYVCPDQMSSVAPAPFGELQGLFAKETPAAERTVLSRPCPRGAARLGAASGAAQKAL